MNRATSIVVLALVLSNGRAARAWDDPAVQPAPPAESAPIVPPSPGPAALAPNAQPTAPAARPMTNVYRRPMVTGSGYGYGGIPGRGTGIPIGRRYYRGRYYGNYNNRYYGPQYGNF